MKPRKSNLTASRLSQFFESEELPPTSSPPNGRQAKDLSSVSPNVPEITPGSGLRPETKITGAMRVSYASTLRRITLERYLITKILYLIGEVTFKDILVLYDNFIWCEDKCKKDPGFQKKFGTDLLILAKILKETRFSYQNFPHTLKILSVKLQILHESFAFPRRNLQGIEIHVRGKFHVVMHRESGVPRNQIPPKPYIGVGYRDKGSKRDKSIDGSPSWQEVVIRRVFPWQD